MQHHQEGGAGYPYGPPLTGMALPQPASASVSVTVGSTPSPSPLQPQPAEANLEQLPAADPNSGSGSGAVNFHDGDGMMVDAGSGRNAGDAGGGAGGSGSRWPREETVALIKIRSEMDGAFRNAALKAPVWEEVSRKLAELGYRRSAKKCKEKFENVDKYYRRTKEGRAGRQDGKSYRFFSELEALHAAAPQPMATADARTAAILQDPLPLAVAPAHPGLGLSDLSLSSDSDSESEDESDEEEDQAGGSGGQEGLDTPTTGAHGGSRSNERMMALFEGMVKKIMEKQDATQRLFLETLEKWEADRTARDEAWRRQELARISREREQLARERAAGAARDAALIAFLQRVGGSSVLPTAMPVHTTPNLDASAGSLQLMLAAEEGGRRGGGEGSAGMSRWPKEEVHALIQLRMEKDEHCQDMGGKAPLWEDISAGMRRIGYNRSSKRCKEKWENINKYFKKVKESNKRRPEDSKTCPYFHRLDAIYRKRQFAVSNAAGGGFSRAASGNTIAAVSASPSQQENTWRELEGKMSNDIDKTYSVGGGSSHAPPGHGEMADAASTVPDAIGTNKKSEDNMMAMEPNMQSQQKEPEETDSDDMEGNYTDDVDDEGNGEDKMKYTIEFQKHKEGGSSSAPAPATAPTVVTSSAPTSSTFLAVQ